MTREIADVLAQHADDYEIRERIHAVPPHEVWAVTVDGRAAVCKIATRPEGDPAAEAAVIDFVDRETSVTVPSILATGPHSFLAEWCDAAPSEADAVIDEVTVRALGKAMATLHEETAFQNYGFPTPDDGAFAVNTRDTWHAVAREYLQDCRRYLARVGYDAEAALVIDAIDETAHLLGDSGAPVLCHGNLLPAHVAVEDGRPGCVVDFEHALVAPPEYDYLRTVMPVFEGRTGHGVDEDVFRDAYESVRPLPAGSDRRKRIFRLLNLVSYLRALDLQNHGIGADERARAEGMAEVIREEVRTLRERRS